MGKTISHRIILMQIFGYARVSTREQSVNSRALEQQIARLKPYTDNVLFDVESGKNDKRKNFKYLENLIKSGNQIIIYVTRLDRLSRRLVTLKKFIDLAISANCEIISLDNQVDTSTAAGKFHIALLGALAEMESDLISERIKHGFNYLIKNGKAWNPPFGFSVENGKFVFDYLPFLSLLSTKETFSKYDLALIIIDLYLAQQNLNKVSEWLFSQFNLKMSPASLSNWLRNPRLQGHLYFPSTKDFFYNQHSPIVDKEKMDEVLNILRNNRQARGSVQKRVYDLSSLIYCSCGSKAVINKGYIYCRLYRKCSVSYQSLKLEFLEKEVHLAISNHAVALSSLLSFSPVENPRIKQLQSELAQLEAIPSPHKAIVLAIQEIKAEIESERMRTSFDSSEGDRKLFIDTFSDPDFWEFFASEPLANRQALLRKFIKKIVFNPFHVEFNL